MFCALNGRHPHAPARQSPAQSRDDDGLAGVGRRAGDEEARRGARGTAEPSGHPARRGASRPDGSYAAEMGSTFDRANAFQRGAAPVLGERARARGSSSGWLHRLDLLGHRIAPGRPALSAVLAGIPVGLLTTTGARSGQPRTVPLLAVPLDDGWGLIASRFGSEQPPAWYFNLRAASAGELRGGRGHAPGPGRAAGGPGPRARALRGPRDLPRVCRLRAAGRWARPRLLRARTPSTTERARGAAAGGSAHSGSPSASRR